ncbi:MAG: hypothetical protein JWR69_4050, partial [Pedosphaera sp.]|nr:hypothetical protein [Pedosphaera sp.]
MNKPGSYLLTIFGVVVLCGCYNLRPSSGGGQARFAPPRQINPADVALPAGYRIAPVATGLTFPTGVVLDDDGRVYVVESGYSYGEVWTTPRLLRIEPGGATTVIASGTRNGPWTGVTFQQGKFFIAEGGELEGGRILRISLDGAITALVTNLPSFGDHHSDGPVIGPDGWLYFGQGTASNAGVVGEDNAQFGWLKRFPAFHDIPGQDIVLSGQNFRSANPLDARDRNGVVTGAFLPFGTASTPGEVIHGSLPCSGAIMRMRTEGGPLELVAWGFRNPFGLAFSPSGQLFVSENGFDERGSRPVWGAPDVLWRVKPGIWYGWPDYSAGMPLNQHRFKSDGKPQPQMLLAAHPN